jgi:hypothetical protein
MERSAIRDETRRWSHGAENFTGSAQPVCRRQQERRGNANACLKRALDGIPRDRQRQAREAIVVAIPCNIGAPERAARLSMPHDLTD